MKMIFIGKRILSFFVFLITVNFSFSQSGKYLNIAPIVQQNENWCWAASMKMTVDFHSPGNTITQSSLAKDLYFFWSNNLGTSLDCSDCKCPYSSNMSTACNLGCKYSIPYSKRPNNINVSYFDHIYSKNGFHSMESIQTGDMDWENIKKEIDSCRPFIVLLNKVNIVFTGIYSQTYSSTSYDHAVLAKGYYQTEVKDSLKYILVNDPEESQVPCKACEFLIPIETFTMAPSKLKSVLSVVRGIYSKKNDTCKPCNATEPILQNNLAKMVSSDPDIYSFISKTTITSADISSLPNPIQFDAKYLISSGTQKFSVLNTSTGVIDLIILLDEGASINTWNIKGITTRECRPDLWGGNVTFIIIGESPDAEPSTFDSDDFSWEEFIQGRFIFRRVNYKEKTYLAPIRDYPNLNVKKNVIYSPSKIERRIDKINKETINAINEALFGKKSFWDCLFGRDNRPYNKK